MKTNYAGIRKQGKEIDSYAVCISLPTRFSKVDKCFDFHIGTVYGLENAIEIRKRAEEIKKEYFDYEDDCIYFLNKLKEFVQEQYMTRKKAVDVLEMMLYEHNCNSCFLDFTNPSSDDEKEAVIEHINKEKALEMAIKYLKG